MNPGQIKCERCGKNKSKYASCYICGRKKDWPKTPFIPPICPELTYRVDQCWYGWTVFLGYSKENEKRDKLEEKWLKGKKCPAQWSKLARQHPEVKEALQELRPDWFN